MKTKGKYIAAVIAAAVMLSSMPLTALGEEPADGTVMVDVTDVSDGSSKNSSDENIDDENPADDMSYETYSDDSTPDNGDSGDVIIEFSGGKGTGEDPYKISSVDDLKKLAEEVNNGNYYNRFFKLTNDITLSGNDVLTPIGTEDHPFSGSFDGDWKKIRSHNVRGTNYVGLFGYVKNGTVKKVNVAYGYVGGNGYVGSIVGYNDGGTIESCYNSAAVEGGNSYVGGIVGYNKGGTVTICENYGAVTGKKQSLYIGGVAGYNDGGTVTNCKNSGTVTGQEQSMYTGGVLGYNYTGAVKSCSNSGSVNGSSDTGGVVGANEAGGMFTDCTNSGTVTGDDKVGGIAGENKDKGTIANCHNTGVVTGGSDAGGVAGSNSGIIEDNYNAGEVSGTSNVGGVTGENKNSGTITNCHNTAVVAGGSNSGGIAGSNSGTIENNYNKGEVNGSSDVGGVVGNNSGTTEKCYNTGKVDGSSNAGGVVGSSSGTTENCYNTGEVSGTSNIGGVAGNVTGNVKYCYNIGDVSGSGVAGNVASSGTITSCYYLNSTATGGTGSEDTDDAKALSIKEFADEIIFADWLSGGVWIIGKDANGNPVRPVLDGFVEDNVTLIDGIWSKFDGNGTEEDPYLIHGLKELEMLRNYVNAGNSGKGIYFKLDDEIDDIDLSSISNWTPIGIYIKGNALNSKPFEGIFDGNKKAISGIKINAVNGSSNGYGLFGYNAGIIKYLGVVDGNINLPGIADEVGGIAGYNTGEIVYCYNYNCFVTGRDRLGGIVGANTSTGYIHECFSTGNITGTFGSAEGAKDDVGSAGGIAGDNGGKILNCYNTGAIESDHYVGGIVGFNSGNGTIDNTYNFGNITGNKNFGGIAGVLQNDGSISYSYYLENTASSVVGDNKGTNVGLDSLNKEEFNDQSIFENAGWDFDNIWIMSEKLGRPIFGKRTPGEEDVTPEDPDTDDPPSNEDPDTDDPSNEDPDTDDPSNEDPDTDDPSNEDPDTDDPSNEDPDTDDPSNEDPDMDDSSNEDQEQEDDPADQGPPAEETQPNDPPVNPNPPGGSWQSPGILPFIPPAAGTSSANKDEDVSSAAGAYEDSKLMDDLAYAGIGMLIPAAAVLAVIIRKRIKSSK